MHRLLRVQYRSTEVGSFSLRRTEPCCITRSRRRRLRLGGGSVGGFGIGLGEVVGLGGGPRRGCDFVTLRAAGAGAGAAAGGAVTAGTGKAMVLLPLSSFFFFVLFFFFLPLPLPWCFHHSASSSALRLAAADFARAIRSPDKRRLSRLTAILSKLSPDGLRELFGMSIGIPGGI